MSTALVGVLGGLAGIVLTGGVQTIVGIVERQRNARTAARLLHMVLVWVGGAMEAADRDHWWNPRIDWDTFMTAWKDNSAALATALDTKDFLIVSGAFMGIDQTRLIRAADLAEEAAQRPSDPPVFGASGILPLYRANVQAALVIVNRASFTWRERSDGAHLPGEREAKGEPPSTGTK